MSIREIHIPPKKTARQNSNSSMNSQFSQGVAGGGVTVSLKGEQEDTAAVFHTEISDIMRGFGDCERPLKESVELVEKIVYQQLRGILMDATEGAVKRKGKPAPTQIDFELLMRKHPVKINRMKKHIKDTKLLKKILDMHAGRPTITEEDASQWSDEEVDTEIVEKYDEEKARRLFRADRIAQILNGTQYQEYSTVRRTSFYCRHSEKMRQKIKNFLNIPPEIQTSPMCLTILAYLIHETIATIVDFAILSRLNSDNRVTDPYSRVTSSGASYAMLHLCPEVTQGRGAEGVKPITVQEIQEAIRRHTMFSRQNMGFHRSTGDLDRRKCYLAI